MKKTANQDKSFAGIQGAVFQKSPLAAGGKINLNSTVFGSHPLHAYPHESMAKKKEE